MPTDHPAVAAEQLSRRYRAGGRLVTALHEVSLTVGAGEVVAVVGPSGSGKSTLLYLLAGLDDPDAGRVAITGTDWHTLRGSARARFRRRSCGFLTQSLALLPHATAAENVEVPLLLDGVDPAERRHRTATMLARVGLADAGAKLPEQLSGGQQQRVAIARAMVTTPAVILADEPTGSLDTATAEQIMDVLLGATADGAAVVVVTHNPRIAQRAARIVTLHSGRIVDTAVPARSNGGTR